jgi:ribosomal protein L37AE/L43A
MAEQVTNYQCPSCLAPLRFDGASGLLVCDSCDNKFEIGLIEQLFADKEQAAAAVGTEPQWDVSMVGGQWSAEEAARLRAYSCPSCAAEIICDYTTAATSCPYCGNPTVVPGMYTGQLKPDYVIPFRLDKNAAVAALKNYYKGKRLLPKTFALDNHLEEIKGIYVPFWLFNAETSAYMRFHATNVRSYTSGSYRVTETKHYRVVRDGNVAFERVPVDASSKMPDAHMDAVEPFNYGDLKPFSSAYLPGFLADKYDQDAEYCSKRANARIIASTEAALKDTVRGYTSVTREFANVNLMKGDIKYALLPVWLLSTRWSKKNFLFAMNGQTGKLIGDLPVDWGRFWAWFAGIAAPLMVAVGFVAFWFF